VEHNPRLAAPPGRKLTVDMLFGDIVVEFDGSYWHHGAEHKDATKTARLIIAGHRVIRIRESPLTALTPHDVLVPANQAAHLTAISVLEAADQYGWLPHLASQAMHAYIQQGIARAGHLAETMINTRLSPITTASHAELTAP
jgi:hypothetical protein